MEHTEEEIERMIEEKKEFVEQLSKEMGGKQVDCLGLPRPVLEKFYHKNAQRLIPELEY